MSAWLLHGECVSLSLHSSLPACLFAICKLSRRRQRLVQEAIQPAEYLDGCDTIINIDFVSAQEEEQQQRVEGTMPRGRHYSPSIHPSAIQSSSPSTGWLARSVIITSLVLWSGRRPVCIKRSTAPTLYAPTDNITIKMLLGAHIHWAVGCLAAIQCFISPPWPTVVHRIYSALTVSVCWLGLILSNN